MRNGPDTYKLMGVNPRAPALGLKKIRLGSNQDECAIKTKKCKICNKEFVSDKFSICIDCRESKGNPNEDIQHHESYKSSFLDELNADLKGNEPAKQMNAISIQN
ncbi:MAG: hypothetical protein PQ964_03720 [Methanobacteriaceae archaeon]|jgi:hypothetical protein